MAYRFATKAQDYTDLAAGHVLQNFPVHPAFPIRLASEIFQRCQHYLRQNGVEEAITLYDPCCGGAYLLTTLAYEHGQHIHTIIGSDINADALKLAELNISLLSLAGLDKRLNDIQSLYSQYGKESHAKAIISAQNLKTRLDHIQKHSFNTHLFLADSTNSLELASALSKTVVDMVITDVPYGAKVTWEGDFENNSPAWHLLEALQTILHKHSVVAIVMDKKQKADHANYTRIDRFQIGKRRIFIFKPNS